MNFDEYQKASSKTAIFPEKPFVTGVSYCALGLTGEAGEVANKIKKIIRNDIGASANIQGIQEELGDVLWYLAQLARMFDLSLDDIAVTNLIKLQSRADRNKIKGEGDNR